MFVALLLFFTRLLIILFPLSLAAHILKLVVQRKGRSEESNLIKTSDPVVIPHVIYTRMSEVNYIHNLRHRKNLD